MPSPLFAEELDPFDDTDRVGGYEVWVGADVARTTWLVYSGVTVAPWGDTHADGFRLRATAGHGGYRYNYDRATTVKVGKTSGDFSIGYQTQIDDLTVKAFAGWAVLSRTFDVPSLGVRTERVDHGFKVAAELWLDWSESAWMSLDAAYADTRSMLDLRLRAGQRIELDISAGLEAIWNRTDMSGEVQTTPGQYSFGTGRIGAFVRYDWFGGEVSAAAGLATDIQGRSGKGIGVSDSASPYGAVTVLFQF
jgi:hypothetical protein